MRILVVDDSSNTCEVMCALLRAERHIVDSALSAREALSLVTKQIYDCILLDILLPDLDGYTLAREIRGVYLFRGRPRLIAISGVPFDSTHPYAADAAFELYLMKPLDVTSLMESIAIK